MIRSSTYEVMTCQSGHQNATISGLSRKSHPGEKWTEGFRDGEVRDGRAVWFEDQVDLVHLPGSGEGELRR